ncbi:uncharacterized protein LOC135497874 [Lineus longissimus]|uniref:uncharacterized protein LOC135497874 n=1 Tax=Lineus longissimus TaxID=88925 RepID=UPI00315D164F
MNIFVMDKTTEIVCCVFGLVLSIVMVSSSNFLEVSNKDYPMHASSYRLKRAIEITPNSGVYRCNEDVSRSCVCAGCPSISGTDQCCMHVHNMSAIVQGVVVRLLRFDVKQFDGDLEIKFRKVVRDNIINYCSLNATRLTYCGFGVNDSVSKTVRLEDVVIIEVYESENYTESVDKYKIFRDLNVVVLVYKTTSPSGTSRRKRAAQSSQTHTYVSQNALKTLMISSISSMERELGVRIGVIWLWDPIPKPFTQTELAGISIGGIFAFLFLMTCCCSIKRIITDRRRILKKRRDRKAIEEALRAASFDQEMEATVNTISNGRLQHELSDDDDGTPEEHTIEATVHQAYSEHYVNNGNLMGKGSRQYSNTNSKRDASITSDHDVMKNGLTKNGITRANQNEKPRLGPRLSYELAVSSYFTNVNNNKVPQKRTRSHDRIIHPADYIEGGDETYHYYDDVTDFNGAAVNAGFEHSVHD